MKKPLILITNDDGINSPGVRAVAEAVNDLGDILIVAPVCQQTSMGRSFPKSADVGIIEKRPFYIDGREIMAYAVHGSPALAVSHAVLELCDRKPDLCISGINYGENLGLSITCSGTVGAAFEADSHGIPSIAISRQVDLESQHSNDFRNLDWTTCKYTTRYLVQHVLKYGLADGISILNVNVPEDATCTSEMRITKQGRHNYSAFIKPESRDMDKSYTLKSRINLNADEIDKESDIYAVVFDKVISITPLTWNLSVHMDKI